MDSACIICFSEVGTASCMSCDKMMCNDCLEQFINLSFKEKKPVECWCGEVIPYSEILKINDNKAINMYETLLYDSFNDKNYDQINKKNNKNLIIEKMRDEKRDFYKSFLDGALMKVVEYAYQQKLKSLDKKNTSFVKTVSMKRCFKELCKGNMQEKEKEYNCLLCTVVFCKDCEKEKNENHTCNEDDIKSLQLIKEATNCPECKVPVEKSYGCDLMTCTACRTNFLYTTGEKINTGNNHNQNFTLKESRPLSVELRSTYDDVIVSLLTRIEACQPSIIDEKSLYNIKDAKKFCKLYEKTRKNFYKRKRYFSIIEEIQKTKKNLTSKMLTEYLELIV